MSSTSCVFVAPVSVTERGQRRVRVRVLHREAIVRPPSICSSAMGAEADAQADGRNPPQVAAQAGHGIVLIVRVVDATLDQDTTGADRLGIFGGQRTLLGTGRPDERQQRDTDDANRRSSRLHVHRFRADHP
jgi:hypothetical protein